MSKHITMEDWTGSFDKIASPGDTVDEEIAMHFLNCLPPLVQRRDYFQCSEPVYDAERIVYEHSKPDPETGCSEAKSICKMPYQTFTTFYKNTEGVWVYAGNCFKGESVHREPLTQYI